jgi:molybdopterin-containing oxidoreductase family iron-sulfur binding subunit
MNRRTFLKIVGMGSMSMAVGCSPDPYNAPRPEKHLFSLVEAPDDMVIGKASWYATTCRECPAGCGVLAKNREGRVIKVEGNPLHPINQGKLCMRGQAALQGVYNPDRITTPLLKDKDGWKSITYPEAEKILKRKTEAASADGKAGVRMMTEVVGEDLLKLFSESLAQWGAKGPLVFETFAYESLQAANELVFGVKGLPSYRVDQAEVLVSFGADFLETWLSPVEYARMFKAMHALNNGSKGKFFHISPYRSLTGINADLWLACHPGSETAMALGLINEVLHLGRPTGLPRDLRNELEKAASVFTKEKVAKVTGIAVHQFEKVSQALIRSKKPLILGTGAGSSGPNALQTDVAVNYLNMILDRELSLLDFDHRHRVEIAAPRSEVMEFFNTLEKEPVDLLLLNNVNPVFALPAADAVKKTIASESIYVVSFSNFMDETTQQADLVLPVRLPLETWDEYSGKRGIVSTLQPAMGKLTEAPYIGDLFLKAAFGKDNPADNYKSYLVSGLISKKHIKDELGWLMTIQRGGNFELPQPKQKKKSVKKPAAGKIQGLLTDLAEPAAGLTFVAAPSIRFFDGRGANRPWLAEIPDPITRVAWQTPVLVHPETLKTENLKQGDLIQIQTEKGQIEAPVYETHTVLPGVLMMGTGQGHAGFGRYAKRQGTNPFELLPADTHPQSGGPLFVVQGASIKRTGRRLKLAHTDGSRVAYDRKIALSVPFKSLGDLEHRKKDGLTMHDFPLTLPLPEGYNEKRDFYPPIEYEAYRWGMAVDMDKCIGCGACAAACYAENNVGIVREQRIVEGREMAWLSIERYKDPKDPTEMVFLPLMCQHCDNAPCESVCPVYAPHHNKEGMNNQIYNRCIGTRFCAQNCPYKVRRFNWFGWKWPEPTYLQLNPDVTVRSKGVMEKCSFCVQRIKEAHGWAKNENRKIRDGEIIPACVQTCPVEALTFGNLMDKNSRVRKLAADPRAYQVMGYLNTKPAVIYLKKVINEV